MRPPLTHKSALCWIPDESFWFQFQRIRRDHDRHYHRWMPHINLLYPFVSRPNLSGDSQIIDAAQIRPGIEAGGDGSRPDSVGNPPQPQSITLSHFLEEPIQITFGPNDIGYFKHSERSFTVIFEPQDPSVRKRLKLLQASLLQVFPDCSEAEFNVKFVPHLSVGQFSSLKETNDFISSLKSEWRPVCIPFDRIFWIERTGDDTPFLVRQVISICKQTSTPLEISHDSPTDLDVQKFIDRSSVDDEVMYSENDTDPVAYVWNFAYGANLSREKLEKGRSIFTAETYPAYLEGYRLHFSHRGGFGNPHKEPGSSVFGLLHRMKVEDWKRLCGMESGYDPILVQVVRVSPENKSISSHSIHFPVHAWMFRSQPQHILANIALPPASRYVDYILRGAREWHLPASYITFLERFPTIPAESRGHEYYLCRKPDGSIHYVPGCGCGCAKGKREGPGTTSITNNVNVLITATTSQSEPDGRNSGLMNSTPDSSTNPSIPIVNNHNNGSTSTNNPGSTSPVSNINRVWTAPRRASRVQHL